MKLFIGRQQRHRDEATGSRDRSAKPVVAFIVASLSALLLLAIVTGCKNTSVAHYVSPRISGRVIDAQTRDPIKGVKVERVQSATMAKIYQPEKAGEVMQAERGTFTKADGRFILDSKKTVAVFASAGWYSVTVSFRKDGYRQAFASYSRTNAVVSPDGEPVVSAGDIVLERVAASDSR